MQVKQKNSQPLFNSLSIICLLLQLCPQENHRDPRALFSEIWSAQILKGLLHKSYSLRLPQRLIQQPMVPALCKSIAMNIKLTRTKSILQTLFRHTGRQIGLLVIVLDSLPSGHGVKFSLVFMFCSCAPCFAPTVSLPSQEYK